MEREEREKWALQVIQASGGRVWKQAFIAKALARGLSHTGAYDLVNGLIGAGLVAEINLNGHKTLVVQ